MPSVQQNKAIGGVTPLGVITVSTTVPVQISSLLANKDIYWVLTARQLGFSMLGASTGEVYVNYGNFSGLDTNATALIVQHGTSQSLPIGAECCDGLLDVTKWWISGTVNGDKVAVYALDASS